MKINAQQVVDANNKPLENGALFGTTLAETYDATISSATSITLNAGTTSISVSAIDKGIFLKYAAGAASSDFDEFIPANTTVVFARPDGVGTISVIEQAATAAVVVIEK